MSEYRGYAGKSLRFLQESKVKVGDTIKVTEELTYSGILMPRYELSDDQHIVLKLKSGYNVGIEVGKIKKIELISRQKLTKEIPSDIKTNSSLPKVLLLSTGGTIASKVDYRTGGVTPALNASELNAAIPELAKIANIDAEVLFSEYSENLQPEHWKKIAEKLDTCSKSEYKGIVITHGTDTMQYTAAFLSFALSGFPIPIALVGSQRSSDRPSSDAALNLISAVRFVIEGNTKGVFVIMHHNESDDLVVSHLGTRVRKNHTSKRSAFKTIGDDPAFLILDKKIEKNLKKEFFQQKDYNPKLNLDTRVALVKYHPGYDPKLIDYIIESGYQAIIFEGTGLGHIGKTMYDSVKSAKKKGLFLGMTSQCIDGRVSMTVYESGRDLLEMGIVPLNNMIPETALVKAMWALGNTKSVDEMKNLMLEKIASEFSD
ncbi:MAG: Glutamyl-tRNA(Gln) amidotransferase subunit D [Nitrosopumilales archaeon]|nr:MAG: Glutamyl-tRNA(Gln) amidotransferase subunit D [Nitrosopumilales archaeon]